MKYQFTDLYAARARHLPAMMYGPNEGIGDPLISFEYGFADPSLFPRAELLAVSEAVLRDDLNGALNYGNTFIGLREQVAVRLRREGVEADAENILIGYGSSQILALLPQLLVELGDTVIVEGPSFLGAVRQFVDAGAQLVTVPVDAHGMDTDALEDALRSLAAKGVRPKFIYTIPTFQNPNGSTMTLERRKKVVALAAQYGVLIIEDDAYRELRFEGAEVPSLAALDQEGWVVRLGTFSKTLAPGLRQGWAYAPPQIIDLLERLKLEGSSGPFLTRVVARFASTGLLDAHIVALNDLYRRKRDVMLAAIAREFPAEVRYIKPDGGFFIWCTLPKGVSANELVKRSKQRGATFLVGTRCFANGQGDDAIRLAFSYAPIEQIPEGIAAIGAAMRTF